jgi:hypothetical protein
MGRHPVCGDGWTVPKPAPNSQIQATKRGKMTAKRRQPGASCSVWRSVVVRLLLISEQLERIMLRPEPFFIGD